MVPGQALHLGRRPRMKDSCQYTILAQGFSVVLAILLLPIFSTNKNVKNNIKGGALQRMQHICHIDDIYPNNNLDQCEIIHGSVSGGV